MCAVIALKGYLMACEVWKLVLGTNFNCFSTFFIEAGFQLNSELDHLLWGSPACAGITGGWITMPI